MFCLCACITRIKVLFCCIRRWSQTRSNNNICTKADPAPDLRLGFCWFYDSMTIALWHTKMTPRILPGQVGNEFNHPPGAGSMPGGADMDMYEVGNSFYSPFYFSLWTELCLQKIPRWKFRNERRRSTLGISQTSLDNPNNNTFHVKYG